MKRGMDIHVRERGELLRAFFSFLLIAIIILSGLVSYSSPTANTNSSSAVGTSLPLRTSANLQTGPQYLQSPPESPVQLASGLVPPPRPSEVLAKTYGGIGDDAACAVILTSDMGFALTGYTSSSGAGQHDFWLIKTDNYGNVEWNKTFGGPYDDYAYSVAQTSDNGFALVGGTNAFGAGDFDVWLVKTDSSGNMKWSKNFGGTSTDWGYSIIETPDGGLAIAGWTASFGLGSGDFWLVKTDSSGNVQWSNTYGGIGYDEAWSVQQTIDGGFALAGWTESYGSGGSDCWMIKTDAFGSLQWDFVWGGTNYDYAYSVVPDASGGYKLAGETSSVGAGSYDALLISLWLNAASGDSGGGRRPVHW